MTKQRKIKRRNLVAKNCQTFNKSKRQDSKKVKNLHKKIKHKGKELDE